MEFQKNCEQDFAKTKNGDFLCIMTEEQKKKGDIMLPVKYDRLIVKVIDKEKHLFLRFPKEISGNWHNNESLKNKIFESLEWYETRIPNEKNLFVIMPQNYLIKSISPIDKKIVKEAIQLKKKLFQNNIDTIKKSMDKLESDVNTSGILSWKSITAESFSAFFYIKNLQCLSLRSGKA